MSQLKPNPYLSIKDSIVKLEDSYLEEHFITSVIKKVVNSENAGTFFFVQD